MAAQSSFRCQCDLKLTRLSVIISSYLAKFMEHNKLYTTFVHEIVIIFSPIYSSEVTYLISSFNLRINWWMLIPDAMTIPWIYRSPYGKTISVAFINNLYCLNRFSFDDHPSTSKFLVKAIHTNRKAVGSNNTSTWLGSGSWLRYQVPGDALWGNKN